MIINSAKHDQIDKLKLYFKRLKEKNVVKKNLGDFYKNSISLNDLENLLFLLKRYFNFK